MLEVGEKQEVGRVVRQQEVPIGTLKGASSTTSEAKSRSLESSGSILFDGSIWISVSDIAGIDTNRRTRLTG